MNFSIVGNIANDNLIKKQEYWHVINEAKYLKALSKHIDKLRQDRDWSFQEMALRCDIDKSNAYRICKDGKGMTLSTIVKIANGFNITVEEIFSFKY